MKAGVKLGGGSVAIEGGDAFDIFISATGDDSFDGGSLAGATVTLTPPGGRAALAQAITGADGRAVFDLPAGSEGRLEASLAYDGTPEVGTADALEILRIAVGLDPSWGPAAPGHHTAADAVDYDTGFELAAISADGGVGLAGILLGSLSAWG